MTYRQDAMPPEIALTVAYWFKCPMCGHENRYHRIRLNYECKRCKSLCKYNGRIIRENED